MVFAKSSKPLIFGKKHSPHVVMIQQRVHQAKLRVIKGEAEEGKLVTHTIIGQLPNMPLKKTRFEATISAPVEADDNALMKVAQQKLFDHLYATTPKPRRIRVPGRKR